MKYPPRGFVLLAPVRSDGQYAFVQGGFLRVETIFHVRTFPAVEDEGGEAVEDVDLDEEYGLIILKVVDVDGEEQLSTLDSEEELELVYQQFMDVLFDEEGE